MQEVNVNISVQYRSDGFLRKALVVETISELLLKYDRPMLFANEATYAGYQVSLVNRSTDLSWYGG